MTSSSSGPPTGTSGPTSFRRDFLEVPKPVLVFVIPRSLGFFRLMKITTIATNNSEQFADVVYDKQIHLSSNYSDLSDAFFFDSRAATSINEVISLPSLTMIKAGITIQNLGTSSAVSHPTSSRRS